MSAVTPIPAQLSRHFSTPSPRQSIPIITNFHEEPNLYFSSNAFRYENPRGEPVRNKWNGVESTYMAAALLRRDPDHFAVDQAIAFWKGTVDANGNVAGPSLTCEGCLTMAYPMALAGVLRQEECLVELALKHLLARRDWLVDETGIWLRSYPDTNERTYPNWLRGIGWYLLGFAKTLEVIPRATPGWSAAAEELQRAAAWTVTLPREKGLWYCFAHRPETAVETSGSAGITAGLLRAARLGLLTAESLPVVYECLQAIESYLSDDGFLGGVSQSNKAEGGIALQEQGYRIRSQFGLGLAIEAYALSRSDLKSVSSGQA